VGSIFVISDNTADVQSLQLSIGVMHEFFARRRAKNGREFGVGAV
jgi:hypothetical protein